MYAKKQSSQQSFPPKPGKNKAKSIDQIKGAAPDHNVGSVLFGDDKIEALVESCKKDSPEFLALYSRLVNSEDNFVFRYVSDLDKETSGAFRYDASFNNGEGILEICINEKAKNIKAFGGGEKGALYEETYHATQFLDGKIGFGYSAVENDWVTMGYDIYDEIDAKLWTVNNLEWSDLDSKYLYTSPKTKKQAWIYSQLYNLKNMKVKYKRGQEVSIEEQAKDYLMNGESTLATTGGTMVPISPSYPDLKEDRTDLNSYKAMQHFGEGRQKNKHVYGYNIPEKK